MNQVVATATAAGLEAARAMLQTPDDWPSSASGFAYRILDRTGTTKPDFMARPLKQTTAALLRRTPELAGFGYLLNFCDGSTRTLWVEAVDHLRGREIFPSDRQSFIYNPVEVLGIAAGLAALDPNADDRRQWFGNIIVRGLDEGQFRTPLSTTAATAALNEIKTPFVSKCDLDLAALGTPELICAAGINLGFCYGTMLNASQVERTVVERLLVDRFSISDVAEAATILILLQRLTDRIDLTSPDATPAEMIVALCRRFPLLVERLKRRQRGRQGLLVADEYDVQYLLHAILKLHFDDVRPEEFTPSFGGNSSRVDFYLPNEHIVVEAKMTRAGLGQREVTDELINDAARYSKMSDVQTAICLVYDPDRRCNNPATLEHDVANSGSRLKVMAVVCPQGL